MKNKILLPGFILIALSLTFSSCFKDLNLEPPYGLNEASVYDDPNNYINVLAKLYAGLAITGNQGPAGNPDISGIDEGFSAYLRVMWNLEELPTDEAVCGWSDPGIPDLNTWIWNSTNSFVTAMYYRIFFQIPLCNEFIRESSDANMSARGFSDADKTKITEYRQEARFLRALSYYHAMDLFGSVPFVTEDDLPGVFYPTQISRPDLFNYIESELLDIESSLPDPHTNEYARADKAAVWTLLAKLYLNAEVYTGTSRYTDCLTYCNKILDLGGYTLEPDYSQLFHADNNLSNEIIFPVTFDGIHTQTYGGTTFLIHAPVGGTMPPTDFGINTGWAGLRAKPQFVALFPDSTIDRRDMFYTSGQTEDIPTDADLSNFNAGYGVTKWKNIITRSDFTASILDTVMTVTAVSSGSLSPGDYIDGANVMGGTKIVHDLSGSGGTGTYSVSVSQTVLITNINSFVPGSDPTGEYSDIDFPLFRLADVYLMYAEAVLRGGTGGDMGTALGLVNQLRERAYGDASHDVTSIDLNEILAERGRELYWEGYRRTDLIRYGLFTGGSYIWDFKGGPVAGTGTDDHFNLYPLPNSDIVANPNLHQNPGY